jgi:preprotein translocase subunit YajC
MLIRPQKKREREVNEMRKAVKKGDEVITIGGICGKIVNAGEEVLTIQVGGRTKFDVMRWSISKVVNEAPQKNAKASRSAKQDDEAESDAAEAATAEAAIAEEGAPEEAKSPFPKRLKKKTAEEEAGIEE